MTPRQVLNHASAEPFRPFRIKLANGHAEPFRPFRISKASGRVFEIRHPEMVQVGRTTMTIFTYLSENAEEAKEREHEVQLLLNKSIEPIDVRSAAGNN